MSLVERLNNMVKKVQVSHTTVADLTLLLTDAAEQIKYLEDSLTAASTGELPEKYDLNQLLLAQRYEQWEDSRNGH